MGGSKITEVRAHEVFEEQEIRARRDRRTKGQPRWDKHRRECIAPLPSRDQYALGALQARSVHRTG
eukprot:12904664-Prorocentrum_lima.AAC.1